MMNENLLKLLKTESLTERYYIALGLDIESLKVLLQISGVNNSYLNIKQHILINMELGNVYEEDIRCLVDDKLLLTKYKIREIEDYKSKLLYSVDLMRKVKGFNNIELNIFNTIMSSINSVEDKYAIDVLCGYVMNLYNKYNNN